jgi:preprotein translocase subunit SecG
MLSTLLNILHVIVCIFLILVVLLQQGRGGGLSGGGAAQVFGGSGAGNFMTRLTGVCAAIFMITSMSLAWLSSSGDREMRQYEEQSKKSLGQAPGAPIGR